MTAPAARHVRATPCAQRTARTAWSRHRPPLLDCQRVPCVGPPCPETAWTRSWHRSRTPATGTGQKRDTMRHSRNCRVNRHNALVELLHHRAQCQHFFFQLQNDLLCGCFLFFGRVAHRPRLLHFLRHSHTGTDTDGTSVHRMQRWRTHVARKHPALAPHALLRSAVRTLRSVAIVFSSSVLSLYAHCSFMAGGTARGQDTRTTIDTASAQTTGHLTTVTVGTCVPATPALGMGERAAVKRTLVHQFCLQFAALRYHSTTTTSAVGALV